MKKMLQSVSSYFPTSSLDFLGVVQNAGEATKLMSKAGKEFTKRELTICDDSGYQVRVTLFGNHAENYDESLGKPVIAVKDGKVGDFGGRTLSCSFASHYCLEPDVPEAHGLKGWFVQQDQSGGPIDLKTYSGDMSGTGRDPLKVLSQIHDEHLGAGEKVCMYNLNA